MPLRICSQCRRPPATGRLYGGRCPACRAADRAAADPQRPPGRPRLPDHPDGVPTWSLSPGLDPNDFTDEELNAQAVEGTRFCRSCVRLVPVFGEHGQRRRWHGKRCPDCARAYKRADYRAHQEDRQTKQRERGKTRSNDVASACQSVADAAPTVLAGGDPKREDRRERLRKRAVRVAVGRIAKRAARVRRPGRNVAAFRTKEELWARWRARRRRRPISLPDERQDMGGPGRRPRRRGPA